MTTETPIYLDQTRQPPIEDLALVHTHIKLLRTNIMWSDVGIFVDESNKATLILLLQENRVVAILRFFLSVDDSVAAIDSLKAVDGKILFGSYQGSRFTQNQLHSHKKMEQIWLAIPEQIVEFSLHYVKKYFRRLESESKKTGRGKDFSTATKRKVMQDSLGRCMFEGCGEDLGFDELTGTKGNFSYLAHNVASSENGARGIIELSGKLSDDPKNILLLCDKHHRLIDKIAAVDYSAQRLSQMRRDFCSTAKQLLLGLSYQPIPAFSVLWPVHRQVIASPSDLQVAQCLAKINTRLDSLINDVSDNEALLREADPEIVWSLTPQSIDVAADKIIMQTHGVRYKAALFAFGLMPPLIALGAKIGNKSEIIPMLRYRDGGQWVWPADKALGRFYTIDDLDELSDQNSDVVLALSLTAEPNVFNTISREIESATGAKTIKIKALNDVIGNGAMAHPKDGIDFMKDMHKLLHELKDKHGVNRVHLLPCASNAACVFFGKAFDSHHPDILVYDFQNNTMIPRLLISNGDNRCVISLPN